MKIIIPPHHKKAEPVKVLAEIREEAEEMLKLIKEKSFEGFWKNAYALSHPQVSEDPKSFFTVNMEDPYIQENFRSALIINPIILASEDARKEKEACMSSPWRKPWRVKRYHRITVEYWVPGWFGRLKKRREVCTGLKAQIFQHEISHFEGNEYEPI